MGGKVEIFTPLMYGNALTIHMVYANVLSLYVFLDQSLLVYVFFLLSFKTRVNLLRVGDWPLSQETSSLSVFLVFFVLMLCLIKTENNRKQDIIH